MTLAPLRALPVAALLLLVALAPSLSAQRRGEEPDYEDFEEVCPYTKGERELEKKLGYARVGPMPWRGAADSRAVQENCGGVPMIFVETEHFRIASTLNTYRIPNDRDERARLKEEIDRLEEKVGRLKAPKRELDPWLRVHLFAQRAEDVYREFHEDWGIDPASYSAQGPHLGYPNKILLLLCERKSEYGRYLKIYEDSEVEYSYRTGWSGEGMIVCVSSEAITENWKDEKEMPFDSMLTGLVRCCLAANLIDCWNGNLFRAPTWLVYGYAHIVQKRFDSRFPFFDGRTTIYGLEDDKTEWKPRVRNLVGNDFFASSPKMFGWTKYGDLNQRDHIVSWSKLSYLLEERDGDRAAFLTACCPRAKYGSEPDAEARAALQAAALEEHFGLTPAGLDEEWARWVKKTYPRK
jgi:hypothetical protein